MQWKSDKRMTISSSHASWRNRTDGVTAAPHIVKVLKAEGQIKGERENESVYNIAWTF